jgi:hypothetical protein
MLRLVTLTALCGSLLFTSTAQADTISFTTCERTLRGQATDPVWGSAGTDNDVLRMFGTLERIYATDIVSSWWATAYSIYNGHYVYMNFRFRDRAGTVYGAQLYCYWSPPGYPNSVDLGHTPGRIYRDGP